MKTCVSKILLCSTVSVAVRGVRNKYVLLSRVCTIKFQEPSSAEILMTILTVMQIDIAILLPHNVSTDGISGALCRRAALRLLKLPYCH